MSESTPHTGGDRRSYEILHMLGKGGFGTVYRADLLGPGGFRKAVALKILHNDMGGLEEIAERMRDEARMLGLIRHRAIVHVDGLAQIDGRWIVVMEYIEGVQLEDVIKHTAMPAGCALEIVEEVASALDTAYKTVAGPDSAQLKLMHRDIKPANIQLSSRGEVKVLDFGIARAEFAEREAETRDLTFGSLHWMAPERLDRIDAHEGDVYSLGVVAIELMTGTRYGKAQASPKRHADVLEKNMVLLDEQGVPQEVRAFLRKCLEYEPEDRMDAGEMAKQARSLSRKLDGEALVEWASANVPNVPKVEAPETDDLYGTILNETGATVGNDFAEEPARTNEATRAVAVAVGGLAVSGVAVAGVVGVVLLGALAVGAIWWSNRPAAPPGIEPPPELVEVGDGDISPDELEAMAAEAEADADADAATDEADTTGAEDPEASEGKSADIGAATSTSKSNASGSKLYTFASATSPDSACGKMSELEIEATKGTLDRRKVGCLESYARDTKQKLVDRRTMGRVLVVNDQAACRGGDCKNYEAFQPWYFTELDRSDPSMMLQWSIHNFKTGPKSNRRLQEAVTWSERALERKSDWKGVDFVRNVERAHETRGQAAYAMWSLAHEKDPFNIDPKLTGQAKTATVDWLNYRLHLGKSPGKAQQMCESVTGSGDVCGKASDDIAKKVTVSFISAPLGAFVSIDGKQLGKAPLTHELPHGEHTLKMVLPENVGGGALAERKITVGPKEPTRYVWKGLIGEWDEGR